MLPNLKSLVVPILLLTASAVMAVGDASTSFQIFVPANNEPIGRDSALIVTNVSPATSIVTIQDRADDGDSDDTYTSLSLGTGQSQVVYIKDGAVNDDALGKWDGDYFIITATEPVVSQVATKSDWQWDFVPADNKTMRGQSFYIYSPSTTFSDRDLNVFAYEPDTEVSLLRISPAALNVTGITQVDLANPVEVFKATLQPGEDLIVTKNLGVDVLKPGQTYWIRATRPITCMSGSLVGNARDGMGFVPSSNGSSTGELFYFFMPSDYTGERELRLIAWENGTEALFEGWNAATRVWVPIRTFQLNSSEKGDWVEAGNANPVYRLFRLTTNPGRPVSVLIQSWMETGGLAVTKDDTSFASSRSGFGAGKQFLFYLPPPGDQSRVANYKSQQSHIFLYGHVQGTQWTVRDTDTSGQLVLRSGVLNRGEYARVSVSSATYNSMNRPAEGRRPYISVQANHIITCQASNFNDNWMTYVPSVTLPNPVLTATSLDQRLSISQPARFRFDATNEGASALTNSEIVISLDPGALYVSSSFNGLSPSSPSITTETLTGRQILKWSGLTIPEGATIGAEVTVTARTRRANGVRVRNGDFLLHTVTIRGEGFGAPAAQGGESEVFTAQASAAATVLDSNQTALNFFTAQTSGTGVAVRWQTVTEPDVDLFRVYRAANATGPFTLLSNGTVTGTGDSATGGTYVVGDQPASGTTTWYYRLDLVDTEGAVRSAGPVAVSTMDTVPPDNPTISTVSTGNGFVDLVFQGGNRDGDLKAYHLFRSNTEGGPFTAIGTPSSTPTYRDETVLNGLTYFYKVQAADQRGNRSSLSAAARADLPSTVTETWSVAYEDQLGPSANDWDYNDFMLTQKAEETFVVGGLSGTVVRIEAMARGANFPNQFWQRIKVQGNWTATVDLFTDRNTTTPFSTRNYSGTGPANLPIWNLTRDALPAFDNTNFTNVATRQTTATLGQVAVIRVTVGNPALNLSVKRHRAPYDPYLKSNLGEIHLVREGYPESTEVVAFDKNKTSPLFGFNADYALAIPTDHWYWMIESRRIWNGYSRFAKHLLSGKSADLDWWLASGRASSETWNNYPAPLALRRDRPAAPADEAPTGTLEVVDTMSTVVVGPVGVVATLGEDFEIANGIVWGGGDLVHGVDAKGVSTTYTANSSRSRPLVAQLVPGGDMVLITAEERYESAGAIEARTWPAGSLLWRVPTQGSVKSALVLASLDGPQAPRTILAVTDESRLYAINAMGGLRFPVVELGESELPAKNILAMPTPTVADLDGNSSLEILTASTSGQVAVLSGQTGLPLSGWPRQATGPVVASPLVLKESTTGQARIHVAAMDGKLMIWDARGYGQPGLPLSLGAPVVASPARLNQSTGIWGLGNGKLVAVSASGVLGTTWNTGVVSQIRSTPLVADFNGDGLVDLMAITENGTMNAWETSGTILGGFPLSLNGAVQGSPLVADVDFDGRLEVWVATARGELLKWISPDPSPLGYAQRAPWPSVGGSITGQGTQEIYTAPALPAASVSDWQNY